MPFWAVAGRACAQRSDWVAVKAEVRNTYVLHMPARQRSRSAPATRSVRSDHGCGVPPAVSAGVGAASFGGLRRLTRARQRVIEIGQDILYRLKPDGNPYNLWPCPRCDPLRIRQLAMGG